MQPLCIFCPERKKWAFLSIVEIWKRTFSSHGQLREAFFKVGIHPAVTERVLSQVSKMTDEDQTAVLKALIYDASTSQNPELFIVRMDQWVRDTSPKLFLKEK